MVDSFKEVIRCLLRIINKNFNILFIIFILNFIDYLIIILSLLFNKCNIEYFIKESLNKIFKVLFIITLIFIEIILIDIKNIFTIGIDYIGFIFVVSILAILVNDVDNLLKKFKEYKIFIPNSIYILLKYIKSIIEKFYSNFNENKKNRR